MFNKMEELRQYKKILLPLAIFLFVLGGSSAGMFLLLERIFATKQAYEATRSDRLTLQERANTLREANVQFNDVTTQKLVLALPAEGTALYVAAQLRSLASQKEVFMQNLVIDAPVLASATQTIPQIYVDFSLSGSYDNVVGFLDELILSLPVINFESLELAQNDQTVEGTIRLIAYSAPYPTELPAITNSISGVSPEEQQIVDQVNGFRAPSLARADEVLPIENTERQDPFSSGSPVSIPPSPEENQSEEEL